MTGPEEIGDGLPPPADAEKSSIPPPAAEDKTLKPRRGGRPKKSQEAIDRETAELVDLLSSGLTRDNIMRILGVKSMDALNKRIQRLGLAASRIIPDHIITTVEEELKNPNATRTYAQIASEHQISPETVARIAARLRNEGLPKRSSGPRPKSEDSIFPSKTPQI